MRRILIALALAALVAAPVAARAVPAMDEICITFAEGAVLNCVSTPPFTLQNGYVVALNISAASGMSGWEIHFETDPTYHVFNYYAPPGIIPLIWLPPDFMIGYSTPQPWQPVMVMMRFDVFALDPDPIYLHLGPASYAAGTDPDDIRTLFSCTGTGRAEGCMNCDCAEVVPALERSWGAIKNLYR